MLNKYISAVLFNIPSTITLLSFLLTVYVEMEEVLYTPGTFFARFTAEGADSINRGYRLIPTLPMDI